MAVLNVKIRYNLPIRTPPLPSVQDPMAASGNILDALAPDILNCIAEHTAREDLPNLHLVSKDFCGAVRQLSIDLHPSRQIQDSHLAYLASHFPRATDLDLRECQSLTHHAFTILGRFSNLRRLSLHNCKWVFSTAAAEQLSQLTRLEALDLSKCNTLGPLPDGITKLARLKDLKLKECASLVELPAGIGALSELQTLDLGGCTVSNDTVYSKYSRSLAQGRTI